MIVDLNEKDFKLIKISLERQLKDSNDTSYINKLINYIDDCIEESTPVKFDNESVNDYRLTNQERNS